MHEIAHAARGSRRRHSRNLATVPRCPYLLLQDCQVPRCVPGVEGLRADPERADHPLQDPALLPRPATARLRRRKENRESEKLSTFDQSLVVVEQNEMCWLLFCE